MARRTIFGPDMGISGWTPIDDDDRDLPFVVRPVAAKNLMLPKNDGGNSYVDIGNGMYVPARTYSKPEIAADTIADERWQHFLTQQRADLPPDDIAYVVPKISLIDKGFIPNRSGVGGEAVSGNRHGEYGTAKGFVGRAKANGHDNILRDEKGNITYRNVGGDAELKAGMAEMRGNLEGEQGSIGGTFNGPNARAIGGANLKYNVNPDGTTSMDARVNGEVGAYVYDGSLDGSVNIPLTWLNNRWRALKKYFGEDKGERREMDLVLGGRASLGVGAGAKAGAIIGDQGDGINGFRLYGGGGVGLVPGVDVKLGVRDRTGMHDVETPVRLPTSKIAPHNWDNAAQGNRVNFPPAWR